ESTKNYFTSGKEVREKNGGPAMAYYSMTGIGRVSYTADNSYGHREVYLTDHLGSTREIYDLDSGKVTFAAHYYPFGKEVVTTGSSTANASPTEKFTTKELDKGFDLTYFGARYYDQDLGLWTS